MEDNKNGRLGFFRRAFLAITDFRIYPFVQREKVKAATAYYTLLIVLITLFLTFSFSTRIFEFVSSVLYDYDNSIPEFIFKDGVLDVDETTYNTKDGNRFVIDTELSCEEFAKTDEGREVLLSNSFLVINKDGVIYGTKESTIIYPFADFKFVLTKSELKNFLTIINEDVTVKMAIASIVWLTFFISYYIAKMINVLVLIFMAFVLNLMFGMKLKFSNYYRIVVYAITLPLIVELISIMTLGRLPEYAVFAYQLLAYVYIFYALRALKLDSILIGTPGSEIREKIENMIQKLENEIEEKAKKEDDEHENNDKKE